MGVATRILVGTVGWIFTLLGLLLVVLNLKNPPADTSSGRDILIIYFGFFTLMGGTALLFCARVLTLMEANMYDKTDQENIR